MNYTVRWLPDAEQELAQIWLQALDRNAVTQAAHAIDRCLETSPDEGGESRPNGRRILFAFPLGILFRILPGTRLVEVMHVWRLRKRTLG